MGDHDTSRNQLVAELRALRRRVGELERVAGTRGCHGDIAERDAAFRRLFEHSRDAMYITAVDGTVLEANQTFLDLFGYSSDELIGGDVRRLYSDPDQRPFFQAEIETKGSVKDFPIKFRRKDGTVIDCLLTSTVRRANSGEVLGYEGIIRDISEQKRAEQVLRQTTESFQALLNAAPDAAFLLDREGRFIALNRNTAERLGYKIEDLRGKSAFEVVPASVAKSRWEHFQHVIRERRQLNFEDERNGRFFSIHLCPVLDEIGEVSSVAVYSREITDAKLIERQLWKAHGELEALVEERTAELVRSNQALRKGIAERRKVESNLAEELRKFRSLYALAVHLTAEHSLDENLSLVVEHSRRLLSADTSYIALRDAQAGDVYMHTLSGITTEAFKKMRIPYGKGLGGIVAETGKGLIVRDYFEEMEPLLHDVVREEGLISGLAVPIQSGQENLGVLYAFNRTRTDFSESDLETLSLLGNLAAVEITRKRAQQELRQAHEFLELQVEQRTAQLKKANAKLILEITEREKAEEALRRNRQMLDNILSASPLGISYVKKGKLKWTNQTMILMFGYPAPANYLDKALSEFYASQEEYQRVRSIFLQDLQEGRPTEVEALFKRADGSTFYGQLRIRALDPFNPGEGTISTISDISDRKRAEEALRQSEEKYRT
ncbi:MAG: PAS domain S-box protein, partial [Desulfomonile sp.]|nr:PAS domain S-box protein [Desulfomonile sp.]